MLPNINTLASNMARDIREASILGALAFSAMHGLQTDDISENDAFKRYGRAWIEDRVGRGQLHFSRIGGFAKSKKNYSIFEIETLRRAEKCITDEYNNALKQTIQTLLANN